ncbi:chain length determinant protein tyrosine kinase EpsG [Ramlibacter sp. AW1]|uniref:Chain length determinant protein tyrosine kinase EpsG n=1 Tax=Ramlibacter aurantiacus TaxID=2801330 RepID=A0A936ZEQ5_9BURK|nr:chain length determinant protein tyrosine kinase EpsG [Ramlibacter aurantiacus]MBL0420189.1 chain length determinant protein tyrosine kinase EpsG [Ramlibacter aurantiacus]
MNSRVLAISREQENNSNTTALALPREAILPMGALLVDNGRLTYEDAERIHQYQERTGQLYGEAGVEMGLLTAQDVRLALALQFGHIALPSDAGLSNELIAAWQPDSPAVEHLRSLRSQLMLRWFENEARHAALAVVSPRKGEGRSYITANLAVLFSQLGKRTLVIDADLRHPRQHRIFGIPGRIGLSALLAGRGGPEAVVDIRGVPGLSVLPAGVCPPNPQELLAREGLARLLASLQSSFEVILVDTPAAEGCADAATVAARAGAALIVACRDTSQVSSMAALSDGLREFGVTVVGAVLNGAGRT